MTTTIREEYNRAMDESRDIIEEPSDVKELVYYLMDKYPQVEYASLVAAAMRILEENADPANIEDYIEGLEEG